MENESVAIGNVTFLGCTLWSDFKLLNNRDIAMSAAQSTMNDYRLIMMGPDGKKLKPLDTELLHIKSRKWLEERLEGVPAQNKIVVVTHNAPSRRSIPEQYRHDPVTAAFATDMEAFVADLRIDLWVHGHLHHASDYTIGNTRVVCNPRGYPDQAYDGFQPGLVIEL